MPLSAVQLEQRRRPWERPLSERLWSRVEVAADGCWNWAGGCDTNGYGIIRVAGRARRTSRMAWLLSHIVIPDELHVLHRCDNRRCCNPSHLFLGTHRENIADMDAKGRRARLHGSLSSNAKLTYERVAEARRRRADGDSLASLARRFGVSQTAITLAVTGRTWKSGDACRS